MGIFSRKQKLEQSSIIEQPEEKRSFLEEWINPILGSLKISTTSNYKESKALKLSTVYRAVSVISDSIAILPIDIYEYKQNWKYKQFNKLYYLLNVQPNKFMSAYTLKKLVVQNMLLQGAAYILIIRDNQGNPVELQLLDTNKMQVKIAGGDVKYIYGTTAYEKDDIIAILNYTNDGINGISTLAYAALTLGTAYSSEEHANKFFSGGGNMSGILRPIAGVNINTDKAKNAKQAFMNSLSSELGQSNSIVVLDSGLEYQPITVNPKDAQLLESRMFNITSISQFFGVPPSKLFDMSKASYASVEASQIDFLNSTILPILERIEIEIYRKIFTEVEYDSTELKFDVSNLLRLDSQAQADYYSKMFLVGAFTPNEIREKINAGFPITGGNRAFVQVNVQPVDNLISEQPDADKQIDNQVK